MTGTVVYWHFVKMFGFIQDQDAGELYFNCGCILRNADVMFESAQ